MKGARWLNQRSNPTMFGVKTITGEFGLISVTDRDSGNSRIRRRRRNEEC